MADIEIGSALLKLGTDSRNYEKGIEKAHRSAKELDTGFQKVAKSALNLKNAIIGIGAGVATGFGLSKVIGSIANVSSSFEQMRLQLDTLTENKGQETLERLNEWALKMPVNTEQAVKAFVRMKAFGLDPTIDTLQTLTDVAVIFGEDALRGVSLAMGQMRALGRVSAQDLNQLANVGVNAREIIKNTFGVTVEELQKSNIEITKVTDALWRGMKEKFGGAAERAMNSWQGLAAVFKSYVTELQRQIGAAGVFDLLKNKLEAINNVLGEWIKNNNELVHDITQKTVRAIEDLIIGLQKVGKLATIIWHTFRLPFDAVDMLVDKTLQGVDKLVRKSKEMIGVIDLSGTRVKLPRNLMPTLGKIDAEQTVGVIKKEAEKSTESLVEMDKEINNKGTDLEKMADKGSEAFERMRNAVQGWGAHFSRTITDALWDAKRGFGGILESFGRMITEMFVQTTFVEPLLAGTFGMASKGGIFGKIFSGLGGGFKIPFFDKGGVVNAPLGQPVPAVVHGGETIIPAGGGGGRTEINIISSKEPRVEETSTGNGGQRIDVIFDEIVADNIRAGTHTFNAMTKTFAGLNRNLIRR